jgi:hypothetical protein
MQKTTEEIERLKASWGKDPAWDIEDTEGFEEHHDELLAFRKKKDEEWEAEKIIRQDKRHELVMAQTGVADKSITAELCTWHDVERAVSSQDGYIGGFETREAIVMAELQMASIRATLLMAAQMKRIADSLENIDDGDSLVRSARIWGNGQ